jgi:hypothetical protein
MFLASTHVLLPLSSTAFVTQIWTPWIKRLLWQPWRIFVYMCHRILKQLMTLRKLMTPLRKEEKIAIDIYLPTQLAMFTTLPRLFSVETP